MILQLNFSCKSEHSTTELKNNFTPEQITDLYKIISVNTIETIQRKENQLNEFKKTHGCGNSHNYCKLLKLQIKKLREKAGIYDADLKKLGVV